MKSVLSFILNFVLGCVSIFVVLIILMQKPSANAGMGASLGGGAAESAFGGDTTAVLTKWTIKGIVVFFVVAFALSMTRISIAHHKEHPSDAVNLEKIVEEDSDVSE